MFHTFSHYAKIIKPEKLQERYPQLHQKEFSAQLQFRRLNILVSHNTVSTHVQLFIHLDNLVQVFLLHEPVLQEHERNELILGQSSISVLVNLGESLIRDLAVVL